MSVMCYLRGGREGEGHSSLKLSSWLLLLLSHLLPLTHTHTNDTGTLRCSGSCVRRVVPWLPLLLLAPGCATE